MSSLYLNQSECESVKLALAEMEAEFGQDYTFTPDVNEFSCKCFGPAQSCAWH